MGNGWSPTPEARGEWAETRAAQVTVEEDLK